MTINCIIGILGITWCLHYQQVAVQRNERSVRTRKTDLVSSFSGYSQKPYRSSNYRLVPNAGIKVNETSIPQSEQSSISYSVLKGNAQELGIHHSANNLLYNKRYSFDEDGGASIKMVRDEEKIIQKIKQTIVCVNSFLSIKRSNVTQPGRVYTIMITDGESKAHAACLASSKNNKISYIAMPQLVDTKYHHHITSYLIDPVFDFLAARLHSFSERKTLSSLKISKKVIFKKVPDI